MVAPTLKTPFICRPCLLRLLHTQSRAFTTSPARRKHGPVPSFHPTPSAELDTLLSTFRSNIFLPAHLIHPQHTLLYKRKNHTLLTSDEPATVKLGGEVHQLHPLDHQKDEPKTRSSFAKAMALMAETGDWRNLPPFLEGLKTARRAIKGWQFEKAVRLANESGKQGVVMECLRRVEETGMGLWDLGVAREAMWGAVWKVIQGNGSEEAVGRARRHAESVWELMWDAKHTENMGGETDVRRRPEVLGVLVLMHAMAKDKEAAEKYAALMFKSWGNASLELQDGDWNDANHKLLMWAPVLAGMDTGNKLFGKGNPIGKTIVEKRKREVKPFVDRCLNVLGNDAMQGGKRRGVKLYEELTKLSSP
ncbi:MAG: hypothetical protein Q9217_001505 [Psora testacea]